MWGREGLDSWTFGGKPRCIKELGVHKGWTGVDGSTTARLNPPDLRN